MKKIDDSLSMISKIRSGVNNLIIAELEKNDIKGIVPSHGDILVNLFKHKELTKTELSENIHRGKSTITKLLNKLIKLDYVAVKIKPDDKRSSIVFLTSKGKNLIPIIFEISEKLNRVEYAGFTEFERDIFYKLLQRVFNNFKSNL